MNEFQEILKLIDSGNKGFQPSDNSQTQMEAFQHVAKMLLHADSLGYLDGLVALKESWSGNRWYTNVVVKNGLTYKGELAARAAPESKEIIQLKPEFHGISLDVKEALRQLLHNFKSGGKK